MHFSCCLLQRHGMGHTFHHHHCCCPWRVSARPIDMTGARLCRFTPQWCPPPSRADKTQLLLCRAPSLDAGKSSLKREPRECIHSGALVFTENRKDELPGKFTVVRRAYLHRERTQYREVAVKALKPHLEDSHLKARHQPLCLTVVIGVWGSCVSLSLLPSAKP